ncbi:MAG: methyltransferase [Bacteroidota bacterium]|jgi:ubiquinone/menaquinone biosynthesis C-methylase UbiE
MKAIRALYEAQKVAFGPFVFQTAHTMLELGIINLLHKGEKGQTIEEISDELKVSKYGVLVLMEMAEIAEIVEKQEGNRYRLTKIGYFIARDEMTQINIKFTQDVCYQGLFFLKESILTGKPVGLKVFGDWKTLYEGLSSFPDHVKKAWFDFDHYYSDNSFDDALGIIFKNAPKKIFDIGGNTGKWAIASTKYNEEVRVDIFDLPGQLKLAKQNIEKIDSIKDRVSYNQIDMLDPDSEIPGGADVYWMSQFLDCFSEAEIESILLKIKKNASKEASIYIMETFIDNQKFPAATYSLVATSLYFTTMANGNSKMYTSTAMKYIIEKAGFKCVNEYHLHGESFHTILEIKIL